MSRMLITTTRAISDEVFISFPRFYLLIFRDRRRQVRERRRETSV